MFVPVITAPDLSCAVLPYASYSSSSGATGTYLARNYPVWYETSHPNRLDIRITGGIGWYWTASGVEYYD